MKNLLIFGSVVLLSMFIVVSCSPDDEQTPDLRIDESFDLNNYSNFGEIISTIFANQAAQAFYLDAIKAGWEYEQSIPLALLLTVEDAEFIDYFENATNDLNLNISVEDFILFLRENPELSLSLYYPDDRDLEEITSFDPNFKVAIIPDGDATEYRFYKNGVFNMTQGRNVEPNFMTLVLQQREGFVALPQNATISEFEFIVPVEYCENLAAQLSSYNQNDKVNQSEITLQGIIYTNPLHNVYILKNVDLVNGYNDLCGIVQQAGGAHINNSGSRNPCERDNLHFEERIERMRIPAGEATLDPFCNWRTKWCQFKVDSYAPSAVVPTPSNVITNETKYLSKERKWLKRTGSNQWVWVHIAFQRWKYLEGIHASQWQYTWTGINPKAGNTVTTTNTFNFSPTIKIKDPSTGLEISVNPFSLGFGRTVARTIRDTPLGNAVIDYCDLCSANSWQGQIIQRVLSFSLQGKVGFKAV